METFGKFELLAPLAQGGMAELFLARQRGMGVVEQMLVLKRILPHLAVQPEFLKLFVQETRIAALLDHPNIVPIYDLGHVEGRYFLAMPYVGGLTMKIMLEAGMQAGIQLPLEVACAMVLQVLDGLSYAHQRTRFDGTPLNVVHRDLCPSNLVIAESGQVLLLDFGIARAVDTAQPDARRGPVRGSLSYMSPEQCRGDAVDQRSDLFSLGVVFHELLTMRRLFRRETEVQTMCALVDGPIANPVEHRPELPPQVAQVVMRALQRDPAARHESAELMRQDLERAMQTAHLSGGPGDIARCMSDSFAAELASERELAHRARSGGAALACGAERATRDRARSGGAALACGAERATRDRARSGPGEGAAQERGQAPRRVRSRRWYYLAGALLLVCAALGALGMCSCLAAPIGQAPQSCSTHCTTVSRSASDPMAVVRSWSKSMARR